MIGNVFSRLVRALRKPGPNRLGVLAIMKNEEMNINEWIAHYLWQGAGQIYLIDNGSTDRSLELARKWEKTNRVHVMVRPGRWQQVKHYRAAYRQFAIGKACEWLMVADLDEFWFCKDGRTIAEALADFARYDLLYARWSVFGSDGHIAHPRSLRSELCLRHPDLGAEVNTKWICRTRALVSLQCISIHKVKCISRARCRGVDDIFQLNHYVTQSEEYFRKVKMSRGDAASAAAQNIRDMGYFRAYDAPCTYRDCALAELVAAAGAKAQPGMAQEPFPAGDQEANLHNRVTI